MYLFSFIHVILKVVYSQRVWWLDPFSDQGEIELVDFDKFFLLLQQLHHLEKLSQVDLHDELLNQVRRFLPQLEEVIGHLLDSFNIFVLNVLIQ